MCLFHLQVGDSAVGKTSLIQRFVDGGFDESVNPTIGMDVKVKMVPMDGQNHKLAIWDTAGTFVSPHALIPPPHLFLVIAEDFYSTLAFVSHAHVPARVPWSLPCLLFPDT